MRALFKYLLFPNKTVNSFPIYCMFHRVFSVSLTDQKASFLREHLR